MTQSETDTGKADEAAHDASDNSTDSAATVTETAPEPAAPVARRGGRGLALLALLLALVAAGAAGYLFYQVELVQKLQHASQSAELTRQLDSVADKIKGLEKIDNTLHQGQLALARNINEKISARLEQMGQQQQTLTDSLQKVYAQLNRNLDSWALEEVEQLLRIANHSLVLNRDIHTAVAGLELADNRLQDQGDPGLLPVRRQIANDIAALKAVPQVDINGVALRLGGMRGTVDKLPLSEQPHRELVAAAKDKTATAKAGTWLASSKELLTDTLGLIRIQNISKPVRPLLTPEQRHFLLANLRLMLGGAQLAALHGDSNTYRDNLAQAQQWLGEYFDTSDSRVTETVSSLQEMQKLELKPPLPDISGSIAALEAAKQKTASE